MPPTRSELLRVYDFLASQIRLDFPPDTPHMSGCNGTLRHTFAWMTRTAPAVRDGWRAWLARMCIDCDCAFLMQLNPMTVEHGALEGLNMRRCSACNRLLALYLVAPTQAADATELIEWATQAQVPAYVITLSKRDTPDMAAITKVYPAGTTFQLTAKQFFEAVLSQLEWQHQCSGQ